jgi:peptide-methionine (S)-S-oxide reductase
MILMVISQSVFAMDGQFEKATLGGGCFWCVEAVFKEMQGIKEVIPGYSGGHVKNPSYREVCSGETGHAEVVQITFNSEEVTFGEILDVFFSIHDPTTLNRQGADIGTQYRSVIFYHSDFQKKTAESIIIRMESENIHDGPFVTQVVPFVEFFSAEAYHHDYYTRNGNQPYCRMVIAPKIVKFKSKFGNMVR